MRGPCLQVHSENLPPQPSGAEEALVRGSREAGDVVLVVVEALKDLSACFIRAGSPSADGGVVGARGEEVVLWEV